MVALIVRGCWLPLIWPGRSLRIHTVALPARLRERELWCVHVRYKKRRDCVVRFFGVSVHEDSSLLIRSRSAACLHELRCLTTNY